MKTLPALSRTAAFALVALVAGWLLPSTASAGWNGDIWAEGGLIDVQMSVEGSPAALYPSPEGDERYYFEARKNRNYSITVRNRSSERVGVLIGVDGLNVVSGERTSLSADEAMYVLNPWETTTIHGWRASLDDVQRFVFVDEQRSYAERIGQANGDMGWIRVLAFREKRPLRRFHPGYPQDYRRDRGSLHEEHDGRANAPGEPGQSREQSAPSQSREQAGASRQVPPSAGNRAAPHAQDEATPPAARSESKDLRESVKPHGEGFSGPARGDSYPGTGWGAHRRDSVREVEFTAERSAIDQHIFRYEYASGLQALGIFDNRDRLRDREHGDLGFARPPRW